MILNRSYERGEGERETGRRRLDQQTSRQGTRNRYPVDLRVMIWIDGSAAK
jgi:hypothetical protein